MQTCRNVRKIDPCLSQSRPSSPHTCIYERHTCASAAPSAISSCSQFATPMPNAGVSIESGCPSEARRVQAEILFCYIMLSYVISYYSRSYYSYYIKGCRRRQRRPTREGDAPPDERPPRTLHPAPRTLNGRLIIVVVITIIAIIIIMIITAIIITIILITVLILIILISSSY